MNTPVKYVAELAPVAEVSLLGTADFAFWNDRLAKEGLVPAEADGGAKLLIAACAARYMGVRFRELSISVFVRPPDGAERDAVYLAHAFNSSRLFAFIERTFFSTPYHHATIHVDVRIPAAIELIENDGVVFRAAMSATATSREPSRSEDVGWEVPIYLPGIGRGSNPRGDLFFAQILGYTQTYPFVPSSDVLTLTPSQSQSTFRWLQESNFSGKEWNIRANATHARSKTRRREELVYKS